MLEELRLKFFQRHDEFRTDLAPVTVFLGPSDAGKSSILRTIEWVMLNRPKGRAMVGRWGKAPYCLAALTLDGHTVTRRVGKANTYRIDGGQPLLPDGVPQAVADLCNVSDANFQNQQDGPFWFSLTPGEVSKRLNAVVNLGLIDKSLAHAAAQVRQRKTAVRVATDRLAAARERRRSLKWAVDLSERLAQIEWLSEQKDSYARKANRIAAAASELVRASRTLSRIDRALALAKVASQRASELMDLSDRQAKLNELLSGLKKAQKAVNRRQPEPTGPAWDAYRAVADRRQGLDRLWQQIEYVEHTIGQSELELDQLRGRLAELSKGVCPLCSQPLSEGSLESRRPTGTCH